MRGLESMMNTFGKSNHPYQKKLDPKTAIYSNEMANDLKKIIKAKTVSDINFLVNKFSAEAADMENILQSMFFVENRKRNNFAFFREKYGLEAARLYFSMEDGENADTAENAGEKKEKGKIGQFASNVWNGIKKIVEKLISAMIAFGKMLQAKITEFLSSFATKIHDKFKAENFKNVNAKVKLPPLPDQWKTNAEGTLEKITSNITEINKANEGGNVHGGGGLDETLNAVKGENGKADPKGKAVFLVWGTTKKPEKKEMTVGEYLGCGAGETPSSLILLSKDSFNSLKELHKANINNVKVAKKMLNDLKANEKKGGNDKEKIKETNGKKDLISALYTYNHTIAIEQFSIRMNVAKAVNIGLGKVKDNKDDKK